MSNKKRFGYRDIPEEKHLDKCERPQLIKTGRQRTYTKGKFYRNPFVKTLLEFQVTNNED